MNGSAEPLPALRQDLRISGGNHLIDGEKSWVILDPIRHRYFQIGKTVFQLISIWKPITAEALGEKFFHRFGYKIMTEEIAAIEKFLLNNNLTDVEGVGVSQRLNSQYQDSRQSWSSKIMHNALFFKVPLFHPDKFLRATFPVVQSLYSKAFLGVLALLLVIGAYFVSRQWDEFISMLQTYFTFQGFLLFGLTLIFVKSVHELAHGYMAVRYGVRVPVMGVAFLLFMPILYTDVSDAWRLKSKRQKVMIDAAGILAELAMAVIATFLWVFLPEGAAKSVAFFIATTSWALSLLINLNPLMRFDGYFILADLLGISNLQTKAFNLGRWSMREILFGFDAPVPEPVERKQAFWLSLYAWAIWVYRFLLFLGIALIIYHAVFKVLGVILFAAEILWFIALPVFKEIGVWWQMRGTIVRSIRSLIFPLILLNAVIFSILPLDRHVEMSAVLSSQEEVRVFSPLPAQLKTVSVAQNQRVKQGQILFELSAPEKIQQLEQAQLRAKLLDSRIARVTADKADLNQLLVLRQQLGAEKEIISGLVYEINNLKIEAPIDGRVAEVLEDMKPGDWVDNESRLALIVNERESEVRGYVNQTDHVRLKSGTEGVFVPDDASLESLPVTISKIAAISTEELNTLPLASIFGGGVQVSKDEQGDLKTDQSAFEIYFDTKTKTTASQMIRGKVVVGAKAESYATKLMRRLINIFVRETGI
ncbi:MAG: HlyD family efflux transporter periplasmic adaptor subunit [Pseudomonadota bacterium]